MIENKTKIVLGIVSIGLVILLYAGFTVDKDEPYICNCNCLAPVINCDQEQKFIYFRYSDDITLFNDRYDITDKEPVKPYYINEYMVRIYNGPEPQNRTLCVEHKFDSVDMEGLYEVPVPEETISRLNYRIDCWDIPKMQRYEHPRYNILVEQSGDSEEQTVRIWLK